MSDIVQEQGEPFAEIVELSELIDEARLAARFFGGQVYRSGYSDIASAEYSVGSVQAVPPEIVTIGFKAERRRESPGGKVENTMYHLGLRVAHTVVRAQLPPEVLEIIDDALSDVGLGASCIPIQRVMDMSYDFGLSDGLYSIHKTYYGVDDVEGRGLQLMLDEEGEVNIGGLLGELQQPFGVPDVGLEEYEQLETEATTDIFILTGVSLIEEASEITIENADATDSSFHTMVRGMKLQLQDIRLARELLHCIRKKDIPAELRDSLGFSDVYNPQPGKN